MEQQYIVYVRIDEQNRITAVNSSAFLDNVTGWVEVDSGYSKEHRHAQSMYFPKTLADERFIYRYKLVDDKPVERTQEEMDADYVPPVDKPTSEERIAQLEEELAAAKILLGLEV